MWSCCLCTAGPLSLVRPHPHPTQLQVQGKPQVPLVCHQMAGVWPLVLLTDDGRMLRTLFNLLFFII